MTAGFGLVLEEFLGQLHVIPLIFPSWMQMRTPNPGIIPTFQTEIGKKRDRASHACAFYQESKNLPRNYSAHICFYLIYEDEPAGHTLLQ